MKRIKKIFKVQSTYQLTIVFIVFGISGSLSVAISGPILEHLDLKNYIAYDFLYFIIRILIIFPIYQIILIIIGTIFGQFKYFWQFEKKFWKKLFNYKESKKN